MSPPPPPPPPTFVAISHQLGEEWRSGAESADVAFVCGGGQRVRAHRLVVAALSPRILGRAVLERGGDEEVVVLAPDVDAKVLEGFLGRCYQGGEGEATVEEAILFLGFSCSPSVADLWAKVVEKEDPTIPHIVQEDVPPEDVLEEANDQDENEAPALSRPRRTTRRAARRNKKPSSSLFGAAPSKTKKFSLLSKGFDKTLKSGFQCKLCQAQVGPPSAKGVPKHFVLLQHLQDHHKDSLPEALESCGVSEEDARREVDRWSKVIEESSSSAEDRTCPECGKEFSRKKAMEIHLEAVHSGKRPFVCSECGQAFARKESFKRHTHQNAKPYLCSVCGKTFARRHVRDVHERDHAGGEEARRFACSYCEKRFLTRQKLGIHERIHTGEKPFACGVCNRRFVQKHQLQTHSRIHTGARPYKCDYCTQMFRHLSTRAKHNCPGKTKEVAATPQTQSQPVALASAGPQLVQVQVHRNVIERQGIHIYTNI